MKCFLPFRGRDPDRRERCCARWNFAKCSLLAGIAEWPDRRRPGVECASRLGEGWIVRILPIAPSQAGYSVWDLVVDREQPADFPDALSLATMPYNSINEREIGTTFGLRAQDAIGWNPRSFKFLLNVTDFREARHLFRSLMPNMLGRMGPVLNADRGPAET